MHTHKLRKKHRTRVRNSETTITRNPENPRHTVTWQRWDVTCEACGFNQYSYFWGSAVARANAHARRYAKARR